MKVEIVGAGFGGLETATCLSETLGNDVDVTLIDRHDSFVFGYAKLDVMFGRTSPGAIHLPYRSIAKPGVTFKQEVVTSIDPGSRRVTTDKETYDGDVIVVALGAEYDVSATPGLADGGHEFYSVAGAVALRDILPAFQGGTVAVGVMTPHDTSTSLGARNRGPTTKARHPTESPTSGFSARAEPPAGLGCRQGRSSVAALARSSRRSRRRSRP
jgi:NADPH-dependent 2,4-dienoyl-CoA reductase/sulfur reductase-like enzyme